MGAMLQHKRISAATAQVSPSTPQQDRAQKTTSPRGRLAANLLLELVLTHQTRRGLLHQTNKRQQLVELREVDLEGCPAPVFHRFAVVQQERTVEWGLCDLRFQLANLQLEISNIFAVICPFPFSLFLDRLDEGLCGALALDQLRFDLVGLPQEGDLQRVLRRRRGPLAFVLLRSALRSGSRPLLVRLRIMRRRR